MASRIFIFFSFLCLSLGLQAQCDAVTLGVPTSDTTFVQVYHPGFFLLPSGDQNVCMWEVTRLDGTVIYQDTTSGDAFEQGTILFDHTVPISDLMLIEVQIRNTTEGFVCTTRDTLFWEEIEVLPGSFIGNWAVLSPNDGGIEEPISSLEAYLAESSWQVLPNPVQDRIWIQGIEGSFDVRIVNALGQPVTDWQVDMQSETPMQLDALSSGIYYVEVKMDQERPYRAKRILKL